MKTSQTYLIILALLHLLPPLTISNKEDLSFKQIHCAKNFTDDQLLQININNTISNLLEAKTSLEKLSAYAISSFGIGYDTIYGLIQCRGDVCNELCYACMIKAASWIRSSCPNSAEGRIWYNHCFLRYDNYNFLGLPDTSYSRAWPSQDTVEDPETFNRELGLLIDRTQQSAVGKDIKGGFIGRTVIFIGRTVIEHNITINGIGQCTRDLNEPACDHCMEEAVKVMSVGCENRTGCEFVSSCCIFLYDVYDIFLFDSCNASRSSPPASPPSSL